MTNWAVGKQSVREKSFCIFYKTNTVLVSAKPKYYIKMNFLKKGQFTADDPALKCLTYLYLFPVEANNKWCPLVSRFILSILARLFLLQLHSFILNIFQPFVLYFFSKLKRTNTGSVLINRILSR